MDRKVGDNLTGDDLVMRKDHKYLPIGKGGVVFPNSKIPNKIKELEKEISDYNIKIDTYCNIKKRMVLNAILIPEFMGQDISLMEKEIEMLKLRIETLKDVM